MWLLPSMPAFLMHTLGTWPNRSLPNGSCALVVRFDQALVYFDHAECRPLLVDGSRGVLACA